MTRTTSPTPDDPTPRHRPRPIEVPAHWNDHALLGITEFADLIGFPVRTVRDWRRRDVGPTFLPLPPSNRIFTTVAEVRTFLATGRDTGPQSAAPSTAQGASDNDPRPAR